MQAHQFDHPRSHCRTHPALRSRPVANPLHQPRPAPLAEYLLHIPKAHAKHPAQFPKTSKAFRMRLEYLPAQIIIISSCHLLCVAGESPSLPYTIDTIALGVEAQEVVPIQT
jgi:hypothetical protein